MKLYNKPIIGRNIQTPKFGEIKHNSRYRRNMEKSQGNSCCTDLKMQVKSKSNRKVDGPIITTSEEKDSFSYYINDKVKYISKCILMNLKIFLNA